MINDLVIKAAVASLERVLEAHADLAPEFAMQAAKEWADNYKPAQTRTMFAQRGEIKRLNDGLVRGIFINSTNTFPFNEPVLVAV